MTSETPLSINQLSTLLSKQLKVADEKIKSSAKDHIEWNDIKRTPQFLRQRAKLSTYTVDEDFDEMQDNLNFVEKRLLSLNKYTRQFSDSTISTVSSFSTIGAIFKDLFDPYSNLPKAVKDELEREQVIGIQNINVFQNESQRLVYEKEYKLWEDVETYINAVVRIEPAIKTELVYLADTVESKVDEILKLVKSIKKQVKARSYALMDYDKIFDAHENLSLKQRRNELSVKQSQQLYSFERKLDESKSKYEEINSLLKKELPYFFKLVDIALHPIQIMIYYVQLMVAYQINSNIVSISDIVRVTPKELRDVSFYDTLIAEFLLKNKSASENIKELSIVSFRENFLKQLTTSPTQSEVDSVPISNFDPNYEYCQALYHYEGEQKGDLTIKPGDLVKILEDTGNWWKGELDGNIGLFPCNYVKKL